MKFNTSFDVAIVISIVTVFLFANGQAYLSAYLNVFGIDVTSLNLSVQDKVYYGYLNGLHYLLYSLYVLVAYIMLIYCIKCTQCFTNLNQYFLKKAGKYKKTTLRIHNSKFYDRLDKDYNNNSALIILIIVMLFATFYSLLNTENKAKEMAQKDLDSTDFRTVELKKESKSSNIFLIKCGTNVCALMDKNKKTYLEDTKNIVFSVKQTGTKK
ncbi:hypothetical protein [Acinetobacter rathckeae]|uniref:hypothetical protein n=1 Tax=Acinetobacter rathckeae TaxID=2605272 RepID=UPI0018A2A1EC|nr:hypothetical protein [Acinetobacter rathckeae]MBF7686739.1 hypothetical protein [Acinetobacter rathckeae]MBF7695729.1 hypothetical protein [Acinetobacter rathckeae]